MNDKLPCQLVSWNHVYDLTRRLAYQVGKADFAPDVIVAIGRGGYVPGRILSDFLDLMNLTSFKIEHYRGMHKSPLARVTYPLSADVSRQNILLVDDVSDTGDTFRVAIEHIRERSKPAAIRTAALHHKVVSSFVPDFYAEEIVQWRWIIYPWAVIEDVSHFVKEMKPRPATVEAIEKRLEQDYDIRVPRKTLQDVLALMER